MLWWLSSVSKSRAVDNTRLFSWLIHSPRLLPFIWNSISELMFLTGSIFHDRYDYTQDVEVLRTIHCLLESEFLMWPIQLSVVMYKTKRICGKYFVSLSASLFKPCLFPSKINVTKNVQYRKRAFCIWGFKLIKRLEDKLLYMNSNAKYPYYNNSQEKKGA